MLLVARRHTRSVFIHQPLFYRDSPICRIDANQTLLSRIGHLQIADCRIENSLPTESLIPALGICSRISRSVSVSSSPQAKSREDHARSGGVLQWKRGNCKPHDSSKCCRGGQKKKEMHHNVKKLSIGCCRAGVGRTDPTCAAFQAGLTFTA
jgi:hypothetical protein